jgi:hypothetical protein
METYWWTASYDSAGAKQKGNLKVKMGQNLGDFAVLR